MVKELEGIPTFPIFTLGFTGQIAKCLEERMRVDKSSKNFNEFLYDLGIDKEKYFFFHIKKKFIFILGYIIFIIFVGLCIRLIHMRISRLF